MSRLRISKSEIVPSPDNTPVDVLKNIALVMIGRTVNVRADEKKITQGVVAGVLIEAGMPKLVVNGAHYDLSQILRIATSPFKH